MNEALREAGLAENEGKVYLALLGLGRVPVNRIHEATGVHRRNIYDSLNSLIEKGLVTYAYEGKKKYFEPKDPHMLLSYLDEQNRAIERRKRLVMNELPALNARFSRIRTEQTAEIYRGLEGIKTVLRDCLNYKQVLLIGATGSVAERLQTFWPSYNRERVRKKILWRLLIDWEARGKPITESKLYRFKILPKELSSPNVIYVYGDKVANLLWAEQPVIFLIKDREVANSYRNYFGYLWETL